MSIEMTLPLSDALNPGQHRLTQIQVINWGTFHGRHTLYVDRAGTLLTGHPGVGKSTLFDGIGHIFHAAPRLNESAHEASTRKDRRTTYSYMRGRRFKTEAGTLYQRPGATWSALALVYEDGLGSNVCIGAIFDLPANGLEGQVGKHYVMGDRVLDTAALEDHGARRFTPSSLQKSLPGFEAFDVHRAFAEKFRRRLGIDNDKAFSLLRTLQNGKGLDKGVNQFFRYEVLEIPATMKAATGAIEDFSHLRGIHRQLEEARAQRDALASVPEQKLRHDELSAELATLNALVTTQLPAFGAQLATRALRGESAMLTAAVETNTTLIEESGVRKAALEAKVSSLNEQHEAGGGAGLALLEREAEAARKNLADREAVLRTLRENFEAVGLNFTFTSSGLQAMRRQAAVSAENLASIAKDARTMEYEAMASVMNLKDRANKLRLQIDSYAKRGSNIDDRSIAARRAIAAATKLDIEDLPFAGELIDLSPAHGQWRPSAEKALRSLATTLLVKGEDIKSVTRAIDSLSGLGRIRWMDISRIPREVVAGPGDLVGKLDFKHSEAGTWLRAKIAADYPLACVESDAGLHIHDKAISLAGTIKTGSGTFERDTRPVAASDYLLGFTNAEKISELEAKLAKLEAETAKAAAVADDRSAAKDQLSAKLALLGTLASDDRSFASLDASGALNVLQDLEARMAEALSRSGDLSHVRRSLEAARAELEECVGTLAVARAEAGTLSAALEKAWSALRAAGVRDTQTEDWAAEKLAGSEQLAPLVKRLDEGSPVGTTELEAALSALALALSESGAELKREAYTLEASLKDTFRAFAREFGNSAAVSFGTSVEAAEHYVALHQGIIEQGLPQHEEEFREYFSNRSYERFSDLLQLLEEERRSIAERISPLNQILADVTFEHGSRLALEVTTTVPDEARAFRQALKDALAGAYSSRGAGTLSESYKALEALVDALDDSSRAAWRDTVLDVRQHVTISCNEHKPNGEVETGLEPGTLSGGEGQRFTSFIMGAALAYQLGFATAGFTAYGTVMIDEAFIQANSEYAAAGINALQEFGFQLLLAAPEDKIDLSRHLGSVCDIIKHPESNVSGFVASGRSPAVATSIILR
ncbi:chromosome segregation protein SMC [Paeniglutamicibacter sp. ABSL32-1]|uniref:ATP-binding protein n=1 Tax=Paeniglutamicibacter quisquiliarum TaxID=2849498 RepID=UPI001C2DB0ED|nr:ATP-binding protein [Paeniglutamicibacter quisquiliarum]MBV1778965.1 chromosome segregation protein SMC [Paeniglutamicibacter quisquiliarum]